MSAPRASKRETDEQLLERLAPLLSEHLTPTGKVWRENPHRLIEVLCSICLKKYPKRSNSLQRGVATQCDCQNSGKYGRDPRVAVLRDRYTAMIQRCKVNKRYIAKGIQVKFQSQEQFVRWALESLPHENYKGVQFDRIDNNGHYEQGNLRLATPRDNCLNKSNNVFVQYMGQRVALHHVWHLVKTDIPEFPVGRPGLVKAVRAGMSLEDYIVKPKKSGCMTSSMPDPDIVSLYRG